MRRKFTLATLVCASLLGGVFAAVSYAQTANFDLEVTPSPVVETVKPGVPKEIELKVHNKSTAAEQLRIDARKFTVDNATGSIKLEDETPAEIAPWVSFSAQKFTVKPGEWYTQRIRIALPKDTGFSYSFALVIKRANDQPQTEAGRALRGTIADFALINVDRPGAIRKLEVVDFSPDQQVYEFLPAKLTVKFKNTGNTIVAPAGNVFIQQNSNDTKPISTLDVNQTGGYILPGTERPMTLYWQDGFPVYKTTTYDDGTTSQEFEMDWSNLSSFRFGQYTAKLVAIYNDGQRDIPIEKEVTFWVVPYRTIALLIIVVIGLWLFLRYRGRKRTEKAVKKALAARDKQTKQ